MSAYSDNALRAATIAPVVGCIGKVQFDSFGAASRVTKRRGPKAETGRSVYLCLHCHKWHVGSDANNTGKKRALALQEKKRA